MTGTRPSIRQAHKDMTRQRIAAAARACFYRKGVGETSFEEIAGEAGVTRATIYLHFANKTAILLAILAENLDQACGIYARLGALCSAGRAPGAAAVRGWLQGYIRALVRNRKALALFNVTAGDTGVRALIDDYHDRVIALLGAHFPCFDLEAGTDRVRRRTAALLAIARIDMFAAAAAQPEPRIDPEAGLDLVSAELAALLGA